MADVTATGDENILTNESSDLLFRKKQLERLQNEIVDIEDMDSSISITDLGLNDFRMDLVEYVKKNDLGSLPNGMHAACRSCEEKGIMPGVIFVLKNINNEINIDNINQLHPFYLIYVKENGEINYTHLDVKKILDVLRLVSKNETEPLFDICRKFNQETQDGNNMDKYSGLLNKTIESIINVKNDRDVDSLFSKGGTTALIDSIKGIEDFELIAFVIIK
jgi:hypothetical protein